ncbi:MAG: SGNH/GDSL hydrolase family protein [Gemmatirosa sp.]|nr:SGNH/GDSL hydrolase family protein [Gemmatirosa sp.]
MRPRSGWLTILAVCVLVGCAGGGRTRDGRSPRVDRTVISREQMLKGRYTTVYDAVSALRSTWLRPRGPDSFTLPTVVWVYLDENRLGDVESLRNIQPSQVASVRFYDGPSATGRWGVGHGAGVIHVSTWSDGALGFPRSAGIAADQPRWVATWAAGQQVTETRNLPPAPGLGGRTLRQVVHASLGGRRVRLRFSNGFGNGPLTITVARVGASEGKGAIDPQGDVQLTFAGDRSVVIPAGGVVTSDPVAFDLAPLSDVAVSIHFGDVPSDVTGHPGSRTTSYLQDGDAVSAREMPNATHVEHWYVLTGLDVAVSGSAAAVAVLGNSIADGRGSGTDKQNRWPDNLARRLAGDPRTREVAVLNGGIGGNCVLKVCIGPPGIERLDRDVLEQPGIRWLVVSEGVNDIGGARGADGSAAVADSLIAGYQRIVARAHERKVRVYGATILPFGGNGYDTPDHEAARQRVNAWIRTSRVFDAVVDLDAAMRDPQQPSRLRADVDGGDQLHPNEVGYRVMADAFDLRLFTR